MVQHLPSVLISMKFWTIIQRFVADILLDVCVHCCPSFFYCVNHTIGFIGKVTLNQRCKKAADPADISVLFFPAGANFWAMHANKMYQHQCYKQRSALILLTLFISVIVLWALFSSTSASNISGISTSARQHR